MQWVEVYWGKDVSRCDEIINRDSTCIICCWTAPCINVYGQMFLMSQWFPELFVNKENLRKEVFLEWHFHMYAPMDVGLLLKGIWYLPLYSLCFWVPLESWWEEVSHFFVSPCSRALVRMEFRNTVKALRTVLGRVSTRKAIALVGWISAYFCVYLYVRISKHVLV